MSKEESSNDSAGQDGSKGNKPDGNAALFENRSGHKKILRLITVAAYMFSVSFVAIMLSAYYLFLWQPPNPRNLHRPFLDPQTDRLVADVLSTTETYVKSHRGSVPQSVSPVTRLEKFGLLNKTDHSFYGEIELEPKNSFSAKRSSKLNESLASLRNTLVNMGYNAKNHSRNFIDKSSSINNVNQNNTKKSIKMVSGRNSVSRKNAAIDASEDVNVNKTENNMKLTSDNSGFDTSNYTKKVDLRVINVTDESIADQQSFVATPGRYLRSEHPDAKTTIISSDLVVPMESKEATKQTKILSKVLFGIKIREANETKPRYVSNEYHNAMKNVSNADNSDKKLTVTLKSIIESKLYNKPSKTNTKK